MQAKYQGGSLILHDDYIEVHATGLLEKGTQKFGTTDKTIKLEKIAAIGWKEPSLMSNGFMHLALFDDNGSYFLCNSLSDTFNGQARNVFMFTKGQKEGMLNLKAKINDYLEEYGTGPASKSGGKVEASKQLKALQDLLAAGLISQQDFEEQTRGLN